MKKQLMNPTGIMAKKKVLKVPRGTARRLRRINQQPKGE